ncbi:MAG: hypothetical protein QM598_05630 [Protaetiibacter sp.]
MPAKNRDHESREYLLAHKPAEVTHLEELITEATRRDVRNTTLWAFIGPIGVGGIGALLAVLNFSTNEGRNSSPLTFTLIVVATAICGRFAAYKLDQLFNPWGETAGILQQRLEGTDWHKAMALSEPPERDERRNQQAREAGSRDQQRRLDKLEAAVKRTG